MYGCSSGGVFFIDIRFLLSVLFLDYGIGLDLGSALFLEGSFLVLLMIGGFFLLPPGFLLGSVSVSLVFGLAGLLVCWLAGLLGRGLWIVGCGLWIVDCGLCWRWGKERGMGAVIMLRNSLCSVRQA